MIRLLVCMALLVSVGCAGSKGGSGLQPVTGTEGYLPVRSKMFKSVRHDPANEDLYIRFRDGNEIVYRSIPYSEVKGFLRQAGMVGYWRANMKDLYEHDVVNLAKKETGEMAVYEAGFNRGR